MQNTTDTLPKVGQHVIARRGRSQLEGTVKEVLPTYPLVVLSLPDGGFPSTTDYDLWHKDGWTFEATPLLDAIAPDRDMSPVVTL